MGQQDPGKDSTPEQIGVACRGLQDSWSEDEERSHRGIKVRNAAYTIPTAEEAWLFPEKYGLAWP